MYTDLTFPLLQMFPQQKQLPLKFRSFFPLSILKVSMRYKLTENKKFHPHSPTLRGWPFKIEK